MTPELKTYLTTENGKHFLVMTRHRTTTVKFSSPEFWETRAFHWYPKKDFRGRMLSCSGDGEMLEQHNAMVADFLTGKYDEAPK